MSQTKEEMRKQLAKKATKLYGDAKTSLRLALDKDIEDDVLYLAATAYVDVYRQMRALGGNLTRLEPNGRLERLADHEISAEDFVKTYDNFDRAEYQKRIDNALEDLCNDVDNLLEREIEKAKDQCPCCATCEEIAKTIADEFDDDDFDEDDFDDDPCDGVGEEDLGTICRYDGERVVIKVRIDKIVSTAIARGGSTDKSKMLWVTAWIDPTYELANKPTANRLRAVREIVKHWHPDVFYTHVKFTTEEIED